jgi:hypothetical protein
VNAFQSLHDYEEFIYTLPQRFSCISRSTLVVVRRGARVVTVAGEIAFAKGHRLVVKERLTFDKGDFACYGDYTCTTPYNNQS